MWTNGIIHHKNIIISPYFSNNQFDVYYFQFTDNMISTITYIASGECKSGGSIKEWHINWKNTIRIIVFNPDKSPLLPWPKNNPIHHLSNKLNSLPTSSSSSSSSSLLLRWPLAKFKSWNFYYPRAVLIAIFSGVCGLQNQAEAREAIGIALVWVLS